eukprot:scaffold928_cov370-Prasinococcus_capsulatus_cf.AAC.15
MEDARRHAAGCAARVATMRVGVEAGDTETPDMAAGAHSCPSSPSSVASATATAVKDAGLAAPDK